MTLHIQPIIYLPNSALYEFSEIIFLFLKISHVTVQALDEHDISIIFLNYAHIRCENGEKADTLCKTYLGWKTLRNNLGVTFVCIHLSNIF